MRKFYFDIFRWWLVALMLATFGILKDAYGFGEFNFTSYWMSQDLNRRQWEVIELNKKAQKSKAKLDKIEAEENDENEKAKGKTGDVYYQYNPEISLLARQQSIDAFIEFAREGSTMNAEKEKLLNTAFGNVDIMKTVGAALQKKGHSPHSLATAIGYWVVSYLQMAQDTDFTDQQLAAVVKQVERQLKNTEMPDDAEKQMAAEKMLWMTTFQLLSYGDFRQNGNEHGKKAIADISRAMMQRQLGIDTDKMTITDEGLVYK